MSAAIKRLSTIIRPSNSSPPSPNEKKDSIDAPAPAAPVEAATSDAAPTTEAAANGTTTDAVKDANTTAPEVGTNADSPPVDDAKPAPPVDTPKDKEDATTAASVGSKKEKDGKSTTRRDPRDIGRSTIRRFSTILRSQLKDANKDKEPVPPLPTSEDKAKPADGETKAPEENGQAPATTEAPSEAVAKVEGKENSAPVKKDSKPAKPAATKEKSDGAEVGKRRSSSFFTAAREGLQRTAKDVQTRARRQPAAAKAKVSPKAETVPKVVKKGAAKGKQVVVVTGASSGVGLEFVKYFAGQPNTFVIALSRTAEKSAALKPIVNASAKEGHNVRAIKLDVASSRSIQSVTKDIVELTEGRIDVLINAAGSRGDPALKVWDIQGNELETELRNNLVGPIAFTNALIPYLKPMPPKEEAKEEAKEETKEVKEEQAEAKDNVEGKPEEKVEEEKVEEKPVETVEAATAQVAEVTEAKVDVPEPAVATTTAEPTSTEAKDEQPTEATPAEGESTEPAAPAEAPAPAPAILPTQPFVIFLAPADPIQNVDGTVPTGSSFAPSPRTLFSLSRAALQVAIAKYATGLSGKGVGIVGIERHGLHDPHSDVSDEQAAAGVVKLLPELNVRDNGKLLRTSSA